MLAIMFVRVLIMSINRDLRILAVARGLFPLFLLSVASCSQRDAAQSTSASNGDYVLPLNPASDLARNQMQIEIHRATYEELLARPSQSFCLMSQSADEVSQYSPRTFYEEFCSKINRSAPDGASVRYLAGPLEGNIFYCDHFEIDGFEFAENVAKYYVTYNRIAYYDSEAAPAIAYIKAVVPHDAKRVQIIFRQLLSDSLGQVLRLDVDRIKDVDVVSE